MYITIITLMKNVCLVIIDGFGISDDLTGNATLESNFISSLKTSDNYIELYAHGEFVGLPEGVIGNSEAGHQTIGSGRTVAQGLVMVNEAYENGRLRKRIKELQIKSRRIHLIGMLSDAGVHSHTDHLKYILECIPESYEIFIHAISDGIDVPPNTFNRYLSMFDNVVSVSGRYFAMDRDNNWDRTEKVFRMLTQDCNSEIKTDYIGNNYTENKRICLDDEFIIPHKLKNGSISPEDTVIMFNFRADRMRQLYKKLKSYSDTFTLTEYEDGDQNAILKKESGCNTISEWLSKNRKTQAHIAETEKYAHVTYFFNNGREMKFENEEWIMVDSPRVPTFICSPEMSMEQVTDKCIECIGGYFNFIVINLAGPDLLGHTGDFEKTVESVRITDAQIKRIYEECLKNEYVLIITSDHGNSEQMILDGKICKSHTNNKVPFILLNTDRKIVKSQHASLKDISPTILKIMGLEIPSEMTGRSLIE